MHWAAQYLGRPWRPGAEGPDAFDCWGLIRTIYRDRLGIEIPRAGVAQGIDELKKVLQEFNASPLYGLFDEVAAPRDLDGALMVQAKHPIHVGIYLEADGGKIIHCSQRAGVVAQDLSSLAAHGFKVLRWYRPKA